MIGSMKFGAESEKTSEDLEQIYNMLDGFSQSGNSQLGGSKGFTKKMIPGPPPKDDSSNHLDTLHQGSNSYIKLGTIKS
jgi:hypothetical protein